jgi:hypothetical protein
MFCSQNKYCENPANDYDLCMETPINRLSITDDDPVAIYSRDLDLLKALGYTHEEARVLHEVRKDAARIDELKNIPAVLGVCREKLRRLPLSKARTRLLAAANSLAKTLLAIPNN